MSTLLRALNENEPDNRLGRLLDLLLECPEADIPGELFSTSQERLNSSEQYDLITTVIEAVMANPVMTPVYSEALDTTYWIAGHPDQVEQAFLRSLRDQGVEPDLMP